MTCCVSESTKSAGTFRDMLYYSVLLINNYSNDISSHLFWHFFLRFPHQVPVYTSPLPIRATHSAHHVLFYCFNTILINQ